MARKISRSFLTLGVAVVIGAALTYAFWPHPIMVDIGEVKRGKMAITINEEGRTRVHNAYVVSTPVTGRLLRVKVLPGDPVERNRTIVAQMLPSNPEALDLRSRKQAIAEVTAAEAALRSARAELNKAGADRALTTAELKRARRLHEKSIASQSDFDRALREEQAANAQFAVAQANIAMREAELANARAKLTGFRGEEDTKKANRAGSQQHIPIYAPATGRVLRVIKESESALPAGTPIMEIGNIENDLEAVIELLSSDAVKVSPGDPVIFEGWGGSYPLNGVVERIEPYGFTKFSALGVEEQRVNTIVRFTDPKQTMKNLGHGYRIEARIVVWEDHDALIAPSSALFRANKDWAVFVVTEDAATLRKVDIGRNNGIEAQVLDGLKAGEKVILYPSSQLTAGAKVAQRALE